MERIMGFVDDDAKEFAKEIAREFGIEECVAIEAFNFCNPSKPCILTYLYAVYLSLLEKKYKAMFLNKKTFNNKNYSAIFDELEKDKNLLLNEKPLADIFWERLLEFRKRAEQTLKNTNPFSFYFPFTYERINKSGFSSP